MSRKTPDQLRMEARHDFSSLTDIMALLRSETGCPWDREQTHQSIRSNFIEETYEVVEAIDTNDAALMREELGDALLQVVFHARISEEAGEFSIDDVIHDICAKLIHRHPHIFSDVQADTSEAVLENWEKIKKEEKQRIGLSGTLDAIPPSLPSLMRAQKIVKKCAKEQAAPTKEQASAHLAHGAGVVCAPGAEGESLKRALKELLLSTAVIAQQAGLDTEELLYDACRHVCDTVRMAEGEGCAARTGESLAETAFYPE